MSELAKSIDEQLSQPKVNNEDDKNIFYKVFECKGAGRPVGDYVSNRKNTSKLLMLITINLGNKLKQYYKLFKNEEGRAISQNIVQK